MAIETLVCIVIFMILPSSALICGKCFKNDCDKQGICLNGCIVGFYGKKCTYPCQDSCVGNACRLDSRGRGVCTIGCMPGYYGEQCRAPCLSSNIDNKCDRYTGVPPVCNGTVHGPHCLINCECNGQLCDNKGSCHDLCINGHFGKDCRERCQSQCLICSHKDVNCEVCQEGLYGDSCQYKCNSDVHPEITTEHKSVSGCRIHAGSYRLQTTEVTDGESKKIIYATLMAVSFLSVLGTCRVCNDVRKKWFPKENKDVCCTCCRRPVTSLEEKLYNEINETAQRVIWAKD